METPFPIKLLCSVLSSQQPWQTVVCFLALYVPAGLCGHSQILVGKDTFKGMLDPAETVQVSYQVWNGALSLSDSVCLKGTQELR